jgi:hypothetical protein
MHLFDVFKKIGTLAVLEGVIPFFGQFLPVDKTGVIFGKTGSHYIRCPGAEFPFPQASVE